MTRRRRSLETATVDESPKVPLDWDEAIRAHNHRVLVSLLALGVPFDLAEDLTHAAWMRLIERYEAGKIREVKLPGLVIVQARFLALNALEKRN